MTRIYYEDQSDYGPTDFQMLWRYLNKVFLDVRGRRTAEIAAMDITRMSHETRYLIKHLLILQGRFEEYLTTYPNLADLREVGDLDEPLVLSEHPTYWHDYFTKVGIIL